MKERYDLPVPAELEAIVMKLLEKDPAHRIQSAQLLARSLRTLTNTFGWSPEQAEQWWETNLPELGVLMPVEEEDEAALTVTTHVVHA
jgi:serine/threonine protein kinase